MIHLANTFIANIQNIPIQHFALMLGLAAIILAAYAIYAVLTVTKRR